jgi:hypothetical protein
MRKTFVMLVLCSLTSLAGAVVNIYLTDNQGSNEITLAPSQTVELLAWYTAGQDLLIQQFDLEADVTSGLGTITGGTITATPRNTAYDGVNMPGINEGDVELMGGRDDEGSVTPGMGTPLGLVSFHCDGPGDVIIGLADVMTFDTEWTQIYPTYHGMIIHQVPEPATIALLCIGGLLLKRKK